MSQPSEIWKSLDQTVPKNSLRGKSLSVNRSSTVDSAIPMPDIMSMFATMILMVDIHQMLLILTKSILTQQKRAIRLLFKISTSH